MCIFIKLFLNHIYVLTLTIAVTVLHTECSPAFGINELLAASAEEINTLRTGDADLRFYITTVQDG